MVRRVPTQVLAQRCQSSAATYDLSIVVAFGHKELSGPKATNRVSVTSQMLWPSATTNSGGRKAAKVACKLAKIFPIGNTVSSSSCATSQADTAVDGPAHAAHSRLTRLIHTSTTGPLGVQIHRITV